MPAIVYKIAKGRIICTDYSKYTSGTVIVRPKNMTVEQLQAGYNRFTKDYYRMMEIVYRAFKQPNAVATITRLITFATLMLLTVGAWPATAAGETLRASEAVWGNPIVIQKLDNGLEKRFYHKIDNTMNIGSAILCARMVG